MDIASSHLSTSLQSEAEQNPPPTYTHTLSSSILHQVFMHFKPPIAKKKRYEVVS